jgi:hypothetical protein
MWHSDTTVIRLLDGTRAYLHAVIDHFSRRILAWRVADTHAPANSVAVLLEASKRATPSETAPVVLADAGENVNAQVDELIGTGVLRRMTIVERSPFLSQLLRRSITPNRMFENHRPSAPRDREDQDTGHHDEGHRGDDTRDRPAVSHREAPEKARIAGSSP